ncbi:MAG: ATP-binding protein [Cyclobacteriaceae bacterium]
MNTTFANLALLLVRWSHYLVGIVLAIAALVLIGWVGDIDVLKRVIPGVVAMNPLTAVLFLSLGAAFFWLPSQNFLYRVAGNILITFVLLASVTKLIEYGIGVPGGIDTWLFSSQLEADRQGTVSNRMAVNTAFCYLLISLALWLAHRPERWPQRISTYLSLTSFFLVLLSIIGYMYVVDIFYAVLVYVPMALHTAINFLLLSAALLFAHPHRGIMKEIVSPRAGGIVARRILPAIFIIPILLGGIILLGEWQKLYGLDFGLAFFCLGSILLFLITTWRIIEMLNHFDEAREEAEIALQAANHGLATRTDQLEVINRELESFSYSVSHDLRAPLRAIGGYAQVLHEDYEEQLDEGGTHMLQTITRNAEKMGRLIDDLLRFSKVGKSGLRRTTLDMEKLASETFKELTITEDQPIVMKTEPMPKAEGDYTLVALLYQNLISNAIKYSSKKTHPQIQVGAKMQDHAVAYFVQDNGTGFDMRHYNKLFGVFQRLHKQEDFEGTGVGLAIAQKVVFAHGGKIWAEGKIGEGATFYFTLTKTSHH